jgi:hypothetical protein
MHNNNYINELQLENERVFVVHECMYNKKHYSSES